MNPSLDTTNRLPRSRIKIGLDTRLSAGLALTLAVGVGLLLTKVLMSPPAGELRDMAVYLTLSGAASMGIGWLALQAAARALGLSLRFKAFLSSVLAGGVALLNVIVLAQLMFVSTSHDLKLLIAVIVFSAVVTAFFSLWVASIVTQGISVIASGVRSLAQGDLATRVDVGGTDEIARLAEDVNALAARLEATEQQRTALDRERRELTTAVSHDLRTPLASLRAMVEALDDHVVDDAGEIKRYYGTMRREIERLSLMIDDLFELAQMDAGELRLYRQRISLDEVACEVVDAMQAQARQRNVTLDMNPSGRLPELLLDGARIERALANLVRNALEHTPEGGRVMVGLNSDNDWVRLDVSDTGEGIEEEALPHIWERFYRAEKSRKRPNGFNSGTGLGLAIVRGIVEAHGGLVDATSKPGAGSTFSLRLPVDG